MNLQSPGVWASGVWAATVWANNVWYESGLNIADSVYALLSPLQIAGNGENSTITNVTGELSTLTTKTGIPMILNSRGTGKTSTITSAGHGLTSTL